MITSAKQEVALNLKFNILFNAKGNIKSFFPFSLCSFKGRERSDLTSFNVPQSSGFREELNTIELNNIQLPSGGQQLKVQ